MSLLEKIPSTSPARSSPEPTNHSFDRVGSNQSEVHATVLPYTDALAEGGHVRWHGSLLGTAQLFPRYLAGAVKRTANPTDGSGYVTAVAMILPAAPFATRRGCQMTLDIMSNKVEHLAMDLFNVHLETTEGLRYLCCAGGAKVLPNPKLTVRGCLHSAITRIFGAETAHAIRASPGYQDEVKQGRDCTDCVSMAISHGAEDVAQIVVELGLREGSLISERLFDLTARNE